MKTSDDGIFVTYEEIKKISITVGYFALAALTVRLIGNVFSPVVIRVETP